MKNTTDKNQIKQNTLFVEEAYKTFQQTIFIVSGASRVKRFGAFSFACIYFLKQTSSKSKKDGKDQKSVQSSTTPDPGYHMGK